MPLNTSLPIRNAPVWIRNSLQKFRSGKAATTLRLGESPDYLETVALERPRSPLDPADFEPDHFRAYRVTHSHEPYVIERRSTQKEAVSVSQLSLAERKLSVAFVAAESFISEPLARKLIERLLLGKLLKDELKGRYDTVEYVASELGLTTTVLQPFAG